MMCTCKPAARVQPEHFDEFSCVHANEVRRFPGDDHDIIPCICTCHLAIPATTACAQSGSASAGTILSGAA